MTIRASIDGVKHVKVLTAGRGVPSEAQVAQVLDALRDVAAAGPEAVAVMHCTHGINRTGFMVARALCELHDYKLTDALDAFAELRPPGLWRHECVQSPRARRPPRPPRHA